MPLLPLCLLLGYVVHRNRHGELFRDSTDTSAVLQKEQTRDIELLSTPQDIQNTTSSTAGTLAGGGGSEVSEHLSHVQDGHHHAVTVITAADSSITTVHYEDSAINILHV